MTNDDAYQLGLRTGIDLILRGCLNAGDQFVKSPWLVLDTVTKVVEKSLVSLTPDERESL